jgi:hypothetical protein
MGQHGSYIQCRYYQGTLHRLACRLLFQKKKKFQATLLKKKKIPAEALQVATKLFLKLFSKLLNLKKKGLPYFQGKGKGK